MVKKQRSSAKTKKRKSLARRRPADTCLVISPFGTWFDDYYELLYTPAIEDAGLRAVRADDLYKARSIVNDIWELTKNAEILLADLSGKNPNVFYELGLAHAIAKPVVLIADNVDDIPFDLRSLRVIPYNKHVGDWGIQGS
jgi:aromatic ring-opening dioxygenase LigB subunit